MVEDRRQALMGEKIDVVHPEKEFLLSKMRIL